MSRSKLGLQVFFRADVQGNSSHIGFMHRPCYLHHSGYPSFFASATRSEGLLMRMVGTKGIPAAFRKTRRYFK
jgi:hypothetical protein